MKRILFLLPGRIEGDARTIRMVRTISRTARVDLICLDSRPGDLFDDAVTIHSFPAYDFRAAGFRGRLRQHRRFDRFAKVAQSLDASFDVVFAAGFPVLPPAAEVARWTNAALVYDCRRIYLEERERSVGRARLAKRLVLPVVTKAARRTGRKLERKLLGEADLVLAAHSGLSDWLVSTFGVEAPTVIRNLPDPADEPDPGRSAPGLDPADRIVLYRGALVRGRGLTSLVRAAAGFDSGGRLVLAGHGSLESRLSLFASSPDLEGRVIFVESLTAVPADLQVQILESAGLNAELGAAERVLDGMAAGVPVLATDLPETRTLLGPAEAGWLTTARSSADLAATINGILADPEEMRRRGANGRRLQHESFSWPEEEKILHAGVSRLL